jgi:hypothetical protein
LLLFLASQQPPFVCHARDFFEGEMRNFFVNNERIQWHGGSTNPTDSVHVKFNNNWF